jgi:predicted amidohydrolase
MESKTTLAGNDFIKPVHTKIGRVGLATCYDLRFPEYSTLLQKEGMDILTYPSAFTVKTGQAHWEILLKARAIETQSIVIAAAQYGKHSDTRESYGHAMVIDAWGNKLVECSPENPLQIVDINHENTAEIRAKMPVLLHRRNDRYRLNVCE